MPFPEAELVDYAFSLSAADIPPGVAARAGEIALDVLGIGIGAAARRHESWLICEDSVRARIGREPPDEATLWSGAGSLAAEDAALCNGTWAEVLDYQDVLVDPRNNGHAGVILVPATLAVAEQAGSSGAEFLAALVGGLEVTVAILRALGRNHRSAGRGFRTSCLAAPLGAAVACARLLGLPREGALNAMGIAGACAVSGLLSSLSPALGRFGMDKDLANGLAAELAVRSARLAGRGMTGSWEVVTGDRGVLASHGHGDARALRAPRGPADISAVALKKYAACYGVHAAVEAAITLMTEHAVSPAEITGVHVRVKADSASSLASRALVNHMAARFSLPYCVASAVVRRRCSLEDFEGDAIADPAVLAMMDRVTLEADPALTAFHDETGSFPGDVEITTGNGRLRRRIDYPAGTAQRPMTRDEVTAKFRDLTAPHLSSATQRNVIAACADLAGIGLVRDAMRMLRPPEPITTRRQ